MRFSKGCLRGTVSVLGCLIAATALQLSLAPPPTIIAAGNCGTSRAAATEGEEQSMLGLINSYRARSGVSPLAASPNLGRAALWKSADMAANHYFSHDDLSRGWLQRIQDCGYASMNDGENIAAGNSDAASTFEQWRTSPPHNQNLLSPTFHAVGVGRAQSPGGEWYWTADFGPSADSDSSAPAPPFSAAGSATSAAGSTTAAIAASSGGAAPWLLPPLPPSPSARGTIGIGLTVLSNTPGDCLRAHSAPALSASASVCLPNGSPVFLVDGPVTADGHTWWDAFGAGWVAGDFLRPSR